MGNISSTVFGRADNSETSRREEESMSAVDFISDAVVGMDLNHQDYQLTLHQYLSQRYANRYNSQNYQDTQHQQQRQRTDTRTNAPAESNIPLSQQKNLLSKTSSFNNSSDLVILNLKGKKLKEIPRDVFNHYDITSLDLSNNEISIISKEIKKLKNLTRLAFGGNQLISIPEEICSLKGLSWLDFTDNRVSSLPANFANLTQLTSLGASDCRLSEFPKVICDLKNIRKLGIFNNLFSSIPAEIGNLTLLTKLDLSGNSLTSLPDEIGNLRELTWLNLSHNQLESIPDSMANLTKLNELGLAHNKLKRLPDLSRLTQLNLLPVYNNELEELGEWIGNLVELSKLDLSCNFLKSIPGNILLPPKLSFINLRKNRLATFPDKFYDRRIDAMMQVPIPMELVTIDVRENELKSLPLGLIGPNLIELKTSMNLWSLQEDFIASSGAASEEIKTSPIELPSLLNLACAQMIQTDALRPFLIATTLPIQIHILQNTHRCQFCEKPTTASGIDCVLWRATTDSIEVPFTANVCSKSCLKSLDAIPATIK